MKHYICPGCDNIMKPNSYNENCMHCFDCALFYQHTSFPEDALYCFDYSHFAELSPIKGSFEECYKKFKLMKVFR